MKGQKTKLCKYCNAEIAKSAKRCPKCGGNLGIPVWLKIIIAIVIILVCLVSCMNSCSKAVDEVDKQIKDVTNPNITCKINKQYKDKYGYSYYVEGSCVNNGKKDYDYLQVEFICYDKKGNNLGTAMDNTNNLLSGQTWKYKAISLVSDVKKIDHCEYHEASGW